MRAADRRRLNKYDAQAAHMTANAVDFKDDTRTVTVAAAFAAEIERAKSLAASHEGGADAKSQQIDIKDELLDDLEAMLKRLDKAGDMLADEFPGIENLFGVPRNRSQISLLTAARAERDAAAQYEAAIVSCGLPADFIAQITDLINRIEAAGDTADVKHEQSQGSSYAFRDSMQKLAKQSRYLDRANRLRYEHEPQKLGAWITASHTERAPHSNDENTGNQSPNNPNTPVNPS